MITNFHDLCSRNADKFKSIGIHSLVIGGSVGRGTNTLRSDLDLFLLCNASQMSTLKSSGIKSLTPIFGECTFFRGPGYAKFFGTTFTAMYANYSIVQFTLNTKETLVPNLMGALGVKVIFDNEGEFQRYENLCRNLADMSRTYFLNCATNFWIRAVQVLPAIKNKKNWLAARLLVDIRDEMVFLARIETGILGKALNRPMKNAKSEIPTHLLQEIAAVKCSLDRSEQVKEYLYALKWFNEHEKKVCQKLSLPEHILLNNQNVCKWIKQQLV